MIRHFGKCAALLVGNTWRNRTPKEYQNSCVPWNALFTLNVTFHVCASQFMVRIETCFPVVSSNPASEISRHGRVCMHTERRLHRISLKNSIFVKQNYQNVPSVPRKRWDSAHLGGQLLWNRFSKESYLNFCGSYFSPKEEVLTMRTQKVTVYTSISHFKHRIKKFVQCGLSIHKN